MSVRSIGARAALAAAGGLASVALMAAPSWANGVPNPNPPGGNSKQADACAHGGWEKLGPTGTTPPFFKNQDECVSFTADKLK
jgi:hypothetical protein